MEDISIKENLNKLLSIYAEYSDKVNQDMSRNEELIKKSKEIADKLAEESLSGKEGVFTNFYFKEKLADNVIDDFKLKLSVLEQMSKREDGKILLEKFFREYSDNVDKAIDKLTKDDIEFIGQNFKFLKKELGEKGLEINKSDIELMKNIAKSKNIDVKDVNDLIKNIESDENLTIIKEFLKQKNKEMLEKGVLSLLKDGEGSNYYMAHNFAYLRTGFSSDEEKELSKQALTDSNSRWELMQTKGLNENCSIETANNQNKLLNDIFNQYKKARESNNIEEIVELRKRVYEIKSHQGPICDPDTLDKAGKLYVLMGNDIKKHALKEMNNIYSEYSVNKDNYQKLVELKEKLDNLAKKGFIGSEEETASKKSNYDFYNIYGNLYKKIETSLNQLKPPADADSNKEQRIVSPDLTSKEKERRYVSPSL